MFYLRTIVTPIFTTIISSLVVYLLLSPNGFNLQPKVEKHMAEQNKLAAEQKYVAVDKKSMKFVRLGGIVVIVSSLIFTVIVCFNEYLEIEGNSLIIMIALAVFLWLCTLFDCTFFIMLSKKVVYDEEGFTIVNALGVKHRHTYGDVVEVSGNGNKTLKLKNGKIVLFATMSGLSDFINYLNERREKIHNLV